MTKSTKEAQAATGPEKACPVSMFSDGLQQLAQLQKKTLRLEILGSFPAAETVE